MCPNVQKRAEKSCASSIAGDQLQKIQKGLTAKLRVDRKKMTGTKLTSSVLFAIQSNYVNKFLTQVLNSSFIEQCGDFNPCMPPSLGSE